MAKNNENFAFDMFTFLHRPLRVADAKNDNFIERFLTGPQIIWEDFADKMLEILEIPNPELCREDLLIYLKDIVGLTQELSTITADLTPTELRKIILLAVPLWRQKGTEYGYKNIIRLFTGFSARVYNWFDFRFIIGEKSLGQEDLGEDTWLIATPGVGATTPLGNCFLLLQFENAINIKDTSLFRNPIFLYGSSSIQPGGTFADSTYYLQLNDAYMLIPHSSTMDFSDDFTIEMFVDTVVAANFVLFNKEDLITGKQIKIGYNSITNDLIFTLDDGVTTQIETFTSGVNLDDGIGRHLAIVVNWDAGKISCWIAGVRVVYVNIDGAMIQAMVGNIGDMLIGTDTIGGSGFKGGLDGIKFSASSRYDVTLANITPPTTNFIEYQEEELDEFQADIRIVDDGTLDRTLTKRIVNLMRPPSERINLIYVNFYDDFVSGKGQWKTDSGTSYVEKLSDGVSVLKMPALSLEHVDILGADTWTDYLAQFRAVIYTGNIFEIRCCVQDENNYYVFGIDTTTGLASIEKCVAGIRTPLSASVATEVVSAMPPIYLPYYVFMLSCKRNTATGLTTIKAYVDSDLLFEVTDANFSDGTIAVYSGAATESWVDVVELFELPLDTVRIDPNPDL